MRDSWAVLVVTLAVLLGTAGVVMVSRTPPPPVPYETTVRLLTTDPEFYAGRPVALSTDGFEADTHTTLVYRKRAGTPPVVVLQFAAPVTDPRPARVVGTVSGVNGGCVTVSGCVGK